MLWEAGVEGLVGGTIAVIAGNLFDYNNIDDIFMNGGAFLIGYNAFDAIRYAHYRIKNRKK